MYYLQTKASFDAAHFLWKYEGKCRNIHGHRWNVVAKIKSQELEREGQTRGMVVDFGNLKNDLKVFCDYFDHSLIYETGSLKAETVAALQKEEFHLEEVSFRPTAEISHIISTKNWRIQGMEFIVWKYMRRLIIVQFMRKSR